MENCQIISSQTHMSTALNGFSFTNARKAAKSYQFKLQAEKNFHKLKNPIIYASA